MKTTRAKLKQIIKEETDFVVKEYNVFGNTSFGLGPHSDEDVSLQYDIEDYLDIYLEHPLDTSMPYEVAMHPNMIKVRYYIYEDLIKFCLNHAAGATSMPTRDYGFVDAEEEENKLDTAEGGQTSGIIRIGGPPLKARQSYREYTDQLMAYTMEYKPCRLLGMLDLGAGGSPQDQIKSIQKNKLLGKITSTLEKQFIEVLRENPRNKVYLDQKREERKEQMYREREQRYRDERNQRRANIDRYRARAARAMGRARQNMPTFKESKMKITKAALKQLIKEELEAVEAEVEEPQTMETLVADLQELLEKWPACEDEPGGMACTYHKDLEEVVVKYGGHGCPSGATK